MTQTPPAAPIQDDTIDVIALCRLLWTRKLLIAGVALLFGAVATVLALLATPVYRSEAVVMPSGDAALGGGASSLASRFGGLATLAGIDLRGAGARTQEARAVIESRRLVEEFIRRNDLVGALMPPGERATVWHAVQVFRDTVLSVNTDELTSRTTVAVEWKDPAIAAEWANGLIALANELLRAKAIEDSKRNVEYLNKQIAATNVVEMQRVMYELIQNETKTLMLANAQADFAFTVVDPAVVPEARTSPKRKLMVATGLALGFIIAALFVLANDTIRRYVARETAGAA